MSAKLEVKNLKVLIGIALVVAVAGSAFVLRPLFETSKEPAKSRNLREEQDWYALRRPYEKAYSAWKRGGSVDEAESAGKALLARFPGDAGLAVDFAHMSMFRGDRRTAREWLSKALHDRTPGTIGTDLTVISEYAELCRQQGDKAEFDWAMAKISNQDPFKALLKRASAAEKAQEYGMAVDLYRRALELRKDDPVAGAGVMRTRALNAKRQAPGGKAIDP